MRVTLKSTEQKGRTYTLTSEGPPSRFNTIGRRTAYLRLMGGRFGDDPGRQKWSKQPEILFHAGLNGRIEKVSVVFGGKVFHYPVAPEFLRGDAYKVLRAIEEFISGKREPMEKLAAEWRGETEILLRDPKRRAEIKIRVHAADIQDMLERHTHLKLGVERQRTLGKYGIKIKK